MVVLTAAVFQLFIKYMHEYVRFGIADKEKNSTLSFVCSWIPPPALASQTARLIPSLKATNAGCLTASHP